MRMEACNSHMRHSASTAYTRGFMSEISFSFLMDLVALSETGVAVAGAVNPFCGGPTMDRHRTSLQLRFGAFAKHEGVLAFEGGVWVGAAVEAEGIVLQLVAEGAKGLV